jgi:large subunit ribosomal protein L16
MSYLQPKRTKFRKFHQQDRTKKACTNYILKSGTFGVKALQAAQLPSKTIETLRRVFTRRFKRSGKLWICVFPHLNKTRKPIESRMGKGKGAPKYWIAKIQAGQVLFEISGVSEALAKQACLLVGQKVSFQCAFISRST